MSQSEHLIEFNETVPNLTGWEVVSEDVEKKGNLQGSIVGLIAWVRLLSRIPLWKHFDDGMKSTQVDQHWVSRKPEKIELWSRAKEVLSEQSVHA